MELTKILLCITASLGFGKTLKDGSNTTYMHFSYENGNIVFVEINIIPKIPLPTIEPERDIKFTCYTRTGNCQVYVGNVSSLQNCHFNPNKETCFVTHGFLSSERSKTEQSIKHMYLKFKDCNVITVDWSRISVNPAYIIVKEQTIKVSRFLAIFIDFLVTKFSMNLDVVHLVSHSLGAHVMGMAGKNVKSGKCDRITGLDPAGPCYKVEETQNRLAKGDAKCVHAIHTCGKLLGIGVPIADCDFFPNGGVSPQPGCFPDTFGICSHDCSWLYFAESIGSNNFMAVPCGSYNEFLSGNCNNLTKTAMGEPTPCNATGVFYLYKSPEPPFALG